MLAQFKVVKIVDVSVMPTGMLLGRFNLPGNSPESEIQIERKNASQGFSIYFITKITQLPSLFAGCKNMDIGHIKTNSVGFSTFYTDLPMLTEGV